MKVTAQVPLGVSQVASDSLAPLPRSQEHSLWRNFIYRQMQSHPSTGELAAQLPTWTTIATWPWNSPFYEWPTARMTCRSQRPRTKPGTISLPCSVLLSPDVSRITEKQKETSVTSCGDGQTRQKFQKGGEVIVWACKCTCAFILLDKIAEVKRNLCLSWRCMPKYRGEASHDIWLWNPSASRKVLFLKAKCQQSLHQDVQVMD